MHMHMHMHMHMLMHMLMHMRMRFLCGRHVQHKIRAAKRAARSELSVSRGEWRRRGYAQDPSALSTEGLVDEVPRIHISVRVIG
jgi:hypothetical protein